MMHRLDDEQLRCLRDHVAAGNIRVREHPSGGLFIYNYTEQCAFNRAWDETTLKARGLIVDEFGYVVARGMNKFFNYGEAPAPKMGDYSICSVHDKVDGSLGIAYPDADGKMSIATRGSFQSEQAIMGTKILREKYPDWVPLNPSVTYLFEIVYPENRIVLDYGDQTDLVYLGCADNQTGLFYPDTYVGRPLGWSGPIADVIKASATMKSVLEMKPRPNAEGLVLRFLDGQMLKIKQEDYVQLHKIVTNLTPKRAWEALKDGTFDDIVAQLPDDFKRDFGNMANEIWNAQQNLKFLLTVDFNDYHSDCADRKEFAEAVKDHPYKGILFRMLDGKDIEDVLWMAVKPTSKET